jgi:hypothetical protein
MPYRARRAVESANTVIPSNFPPDKGEMKGVYDDSPSAGAFSSLPTPPIPSFMHIRNRWASFLSPTYTAKNGAETL